MVLSYLSIIRNYTPTGWKKPSPMDGSSKTKQRRSYPIASHHVDCPPPCWVMPSSPTTRDVFVRIYRQTNVPVHAGMKIIHSFTSYTNARVTNMPVGLPPKNSTGLITPPTSFSRRPRMLASSSIFSTTHAQPSHHRFNWTPLLTLAKH